MDTKALLTELATSYGHEVKDFYAVDPANGLNPQTVSVPFYHLTTVKGGKEFHTHGDSYEQAVAEFKRRAVCPEHPPVVGEHMFEGFNGDYYSYVVTAVSASGKQVTLRQEQARQVGDYYGIQKWEISDNPQGRVTIARWSDKHQRYVDKGGARFSMGRHWGRNPSF